SGESGTRRLVAKEIHTESDGRRSAIRIRDREDESCRQNAQWPRVHRESATRVVDRFEPCHLERTGPRAGRSARSASAAERLFHPSERTLRRGARISANAASNIEQAPRGGRIEGK